MTKVILIAMLAVLAAVPAAGWPEALWPAHKCSAPAPELLDSVGGDAGGYVTNFAAGLTRPSITSLPAQVVGGLVSINRLDALEFPIRPTSPLAEWAAQDEDAVLRTAPLDTASPDEWHGDRAAVLTSASVEVSRRQRLQGRSGRDRKLWPGRRPRLGAQVWLARRQP